MDGPHYYARKNARVVLVKRQIFTVISGQEGTDEVRSFRWQIVRVARTASQLSVDRPHLLTTSLIALRPFVIQNLLLVAASVWFTPSCS
ncbi:hypothetical protein T01_6267 [Trichinella spiralis]|uniref:Uncharacterized protein n=1 Tax=Trichinella spiralis TaxID=6334 RepID=A0A0V1AX10_TRISP|nr:hypothetical protein T01_6267 [Trichinella spiralis]